MYNNPPMQKKKKSLLPKETNIKAEVTLWFKTFAFSKKSFKKLPEMFLVHYSAPRPKL